MVDDGSSRLLLECGISFKDIQKSLNFETSKLAGVLVTHEHRDHCKGLDSVLKRGLNVYMSKGTKEALAMEHHRIKTVESKKQFEVGSWTALPFDVQHDVSEPLGFLLQSESGEKLLFATDTYYIKYKFTGVNYLMIECNYDQETLNRNVLNGYVHPAMRKRVMKSHFSLENLLEFFKANDLSKVQEIWLLHLSDGNSNEERIRTEVARATGKMIFIP